MSAIIKKSSLKNMGYLLRDITKKFIQHSNKTLIEAIFSLDHRRDISVVVQEMSENQRNLYDFIVVSDRYKFVGDYVFPEGKKAIAVALLNCSSPILKVVDREYDNKYAEIVGYFFLDDNDDSYIKEIDFFNEDVFDLFFESFNEEQLWEEIGEINWAHKHMAPAIYKHGDITLTNFYIKKGDVFDGCVFNFHDYIEDLIGVSPCKWNSRDREVVFCLIVISRSGVQTRFEEFNNKQLTISNVYQQLLSKLQAFSKNPVSYSIDNLLDLAFELKEARCDRINDSFVYRSIDAISLNKQEIVSCKINYNDFSLPGEVKGFFNEYDMDVFSLESYQSACDALFKDYLHSGYPPYFSSSPERLLATLVSVAREKICSDIGMTRGFSDIYEFIENNNNKNYQSMINYRQTDYFCYVDSSEEVVNKFPTTDLLRIVNAISGRMRFNSWHYLPGNFNKEIAGDRDYFFPPILSDIAENSDLHHSGHIHSRVKYSIRSPAPIYIGGHCYNAFVDLRLMRMSGKPYSEKELRLANYFTELIRICYQSLVESIEKYQHQFKFKFATKDWYKSYFNNESNENNLEKSLNKVSA